MEQLRVFARTVEQACYDQIERFMRSPASEGSQVRIMPDTHAGKGCVVGFTMTIQDRVVPNLVGVDIGCFSGDTKVKLTDGRDLSFLELIEEEKKGIEHYGYSLDKNGNVQVSKLELPRKIKTVPYTLIITLDNGEKIRCTDDHIFYKRNMEEVAAKDLKVGDSLYPLYLKKRNELLNENFLSENGLLDKNDEHLCVYDVIYNGYKYVHWLSDDYNFRHNQVRNIHSFVRHHLDFDKFNNDPTNIERVSFKEHFRIHCENIGYLSKIGKSGYKRLVSKYGEEKAREFCSIAGMKRAYSTWHGVNSERNRKIVGKILTARNKSENAREQSRQRQITNNTTKFSEQNKQERFINRQKISKIKKYLEYMVKNNLEITEENWKFVRSNFYNCFHWDKMNSILNEVHLTYQDVLDGKVNKNHYIKSIERIDEEIDVYCLTCFEFSNFALSSGVFVHNCGMLALEVDEVTPQDFVAMCRHVPVGFSSHLEPVADFDLSDLVAPVEHQYRVLCSIGTLGSGNHFIELNRMSSGRMMVVIHTGSRNLGVQVCRYHQGVAGAGELDYLTGSQMEDYLHDMEITQRYAQANRSAIRDILVAHGLRVHSEFETVHNYISFEDMVLRKGAISCQLGERVLIPLNMRDGSLIGVGRGNQEWNYSGPHGAGRLLPRGLARQQLSLADFQASMTGIYSETVLQETIDESPACYKDAHEIIELVQDTIEIVDHISVVANFKGF